MSKFDLKRITKLEVRGKKGWHHGMVWWEKEGEVIWDYPPAGLETHIWFTSSMVEEKKSPWKLNFQGREIAIWCKHLDYKDEPRLVSRFVNSKTKAVITLVTGWSARYDYYTGCRMQVFLDYLDENGNTVSKLVRDVSSNPNGNREGDDELADYSMSELKEFFYFNLDPKSYPKLNEVADETQYREPKPVQEDVYKQPDEYVDEYYDALGIW